MSKFSSKITERVSFLKKADDFIREIDNNALPEYKYNMFNYVMHKHNRGV